MTIDLKSAIKYLILFLIGIGVLYLAFKGQDLHKIWLEIKTANFFWIAVSAFAVWLAHVLRALRWQMLYQSIQYKVNFWNAYHAVIIGYLANLALPRFGEIGRCSVINKTEKVPMFASIGTVITERLFDVLVLFITGLLMLIFQYHIVADFLYNTIYLNLIKKLESLNYIWIIALVIVLLVLCIAGFYFIRQKFSKKFLRIFVSLRQGFGSYSKLKQKGLFLTYTLLIWFLYFLSMYLAFFAIQKTSGLELNAAFTAVVFSGFAMVAPVQGGIGVFHWMVAQALALYAINFKDGLAYATIIHSSQVLLILVLGSLSLATVLLKKQKNNF
ncbi:lysylphosphatidylglycerol synthase transmembrane domain-containing protein [Pedobacter punctiformis]|uniref:Lysylphosphatidylglycerol synthase transmembrane domain-containing protein n=1 Tax=Pedobacter punctiformis TaxID=3004097 RepID=A0ABT4L6C9_9SPHI|nr:lysylphosphatidylglycerol synthase transmembrane domain-containing protein [Pedobacter sp. HCMS5-2]MCZ4243480.1 lysylphosphatidylglycerol synthase transmembrane domain-containing protein [Pedobacter sp. HCMS5-2]